MRCLVVLLAVALIGCDQSAETSKTAQVTPQPPTTPPRVDYQRHRRVVSDITVLTFELDVYRSQYGTYPKTLPGLKHAVEDPWGSSYVYRFPDPHNADSFALFSAGPDKKPDTADDDRGWPSYEDQPFGLSER